MSPREGIPQASGQAPVVELSAAAIEQIARRVAELLREPAPALAAPELIDAAEVARRTGLSRATIYERAAELGAIRIGDGARPRLRFDWSRVVEVLVACTDSRPREAREPAPPPAPRKGRRANLTAGAPSAPQLLPIRGPTTPR